MMHKKTWLIIILYIFSLLTGCQQQFGPPEDIEFEPVSFGFEDLSDYVGEYIKFVATIEFAYYTDCDAEIDGFDACPLYLKDSPHIVNVVMGLSKNSITSSGNIIFSDGTKVEPDPWGRINAVFMGKVRECNQEKECLIDVYQIDQFDEHWYE